MEKPMTVDVAEAHACGVCPAFFLSYPLDRLRRLCSPASGTPLFACQRATASACRLSNVRGRI